MTMQILNPMDECFGAMNTKGFESSLMSNRIPEPDHITYQGAFNELKFSIGAKAKQPMELHIGYARSQNQSSCFDSEINDYLAIFTKGSKDGQDRDDRVLNAIIVLDISGSMSSGLTSMGEGCRLELAKEAIIMFFSKMRANDSFGLVVFDTQGTTLLPSTRKSEINQEMLFQTVKAITTRGGTQLKSGFDQAHKNMKAYLQNFVKVHNGTMENRVIMLTDVGDNSMEDAFTFVQNVEKSHIHTTIIGVSDDFRSETCEKMNEIEGFNYFCATELSDLKKYLFENFSYTFFPVNYDIEIGLECENVKEFEVFGTVDGKKVKEYNLDFKSQLLKAMIITKTKTSFPSQIQIGQDGEVKTYGSLIILKLKLKQNTTKFRAVVKVSLTTPGGQKYSQEYPTEFQSPLNQQYYSQESLGEATSAFHYVFEVKKILEELSKVSGGSGYLNNIKKMEKKNYIEALNKLKPLAPKSKLDELLKLIELIQNLQEQDEPNGIDLME